MGGLQRFEQRLESLISGTFARAFRSAVQPVELAAALQREVDNNAKILSRDRRLVPNDFTIDLSGTDLDRMELNDDAMAARVAQELIDQLRAHADQQGYVFPGPIAIEFDTDEQLTTGRFHIRSRSVASVSGDEPAARSERQPPAMARRTRAVLEINGTRHPLQPPGLVIGRGSEADVRITDPGVSRRHVEFEVRYDQDQDVEVLVRDLGSTNGMLVNGRKMPQAHVGEGSVVRIGHTDMVVRVVSGV